MNEEFEKPIDRIIREARESGAFDNLPGKGKPIRWEDDSLTPEDQRMAYRLLKNNGFTLDWIMLAQELDEEYRVLREKLNAARRERQEGRLDAAGWDLVLQDFQARIRALNRRVTGYNLRAPHEQFHKNPFPLDPD